ncbi:MAG: 4-alpha-glucanotransferase [Candidatus Roizmanbacteria bacterium]
MTSIKRLGTLIPLNSLLSENMKKDDFFGMAYVFIDWLHATGQSIWQMLPLNPTGFDPKQDYFTSPYWSYGIGINPAYIPTFDGQEIIDDVHTDAYEVFVSSQSYWLDGYAVFQCLCENHETDDWRRWDTGFHRPDDEKIKQWTKSFARRVEEIKRVQYNLHQSFEEMKKYAKIHNVELWGDLPFFLPIGSYHCWRYPGAFVLTPEYDLEYIAGSLGGRHWRNRQIWGFPLYDFDHPDTFKLWDERMRHAMTLFDRVRIDSAIRLYEYEMFHVADTHRDKIVQGPGALYMTHFARMAQELNSGIYIEDISEFNMKQLEATAHKLGVLGVSVVTMMFAQSSSEVHEKDFRLFDGQPHIYFSSTHDTCPLAAYLRDLTPAQQHKLATVLTIPNKPYTYRDVVLGLIRHTNIAIIPVQDWIGSTTRINEPGIISDKNWNYRMEVPIEKLPTDILAAR